MVHGPVSGTFWCGCFGNNYSVLSCSSASVETDKRIMKMRHKGSANMDKIFICHNRKLDLANIHVVPISQNVL